MDYSEKATILKCCSNKKGNRCSSCPAFGQGNKNCMRNAMRDASVAIFELLDQVNKYEENISKERSKFKRILIKLQNEYGLSYEDINNILGNSDG